jgi:hypothetical protein
VGYRRLSNESSNAKNIATMVAKLLGRLLNEDHRCNSASTCAHHDRSGCKARNLLAHQSTHRTAIPSLLIAALLAAVPARAADCTGRMRFGIRGAEYRGATDRSRRGTEAPRPSPCCRA